MKTKLLAVLLPVSLLFIAESIGGPEKPASVLEYWVKFSIRNAGMEVRGTVEGVHAEIKFDPKALSQSNILAMADPSTIKTGIGIRDKHLKRRDYFNVAAYPEIRLHSKAFRADGKNKFIGQFDLTIKEVNKEITIPFSLTSENNTVLYQGSFEINRLDFNLGEKSVVLDEKVKVCIRVKMLNGKQS